jgi:hypothetical protein
VLSGYLVLLAQRLGAPRSVIMRMLGNVALDTLGGSVPIAGDLFDVAFKSNVRNVALLERALERPTETRRASRLLVLGTIAGIVVLAAAAIVIAVFAVRAVAAAMHSS